MAFSLKEFKGQRALITGASSGIGKEYAKQLAQNGCHLVLAARRKDRLEALAKTLENQYSIQAQVIPIDLTEPGKAQILFQQAVEQPRTPPITLLINNAGIGKYGDFIDHPLVEHTKTIQLNLISLTELTYLFVQYMLQHGQKSYITQVSSMTGLQPIPQFSIYSASKEYVRSFSETLGFELRKTPVHIFCLCPGGTLTEFFDHSGQTMTATGKASMMSTQEVVQQALRAMLKSRRTLFIPGWINKLGCFLPRFFSRTVALSLSDQIMKRAVKKSL